MRTFKKGDKIEKTKDQFIADALIQSGFVEVKEEKHKKLTLDDDKDEAEEEEKPARGRNRK